MITKAYIALGSNLNDRKLLLALAMEKLQHHPSITVTKQSSVIETDPAGGPPQGRFLNQVIEIQTTLDPEKLLQELQQIELSLGRQRRQKWGPRTMDLDILLYGDSVISQPALQIPHPRMHNRPFVLQPLCEIAPDVLHPVLNQPAVELLRKAMNG